MPLVFWGGRAFPLRPKASYLQFICEILVAAQVPNEDITDELLNTCWTPFCQSKGKCYKFPDKVGILIGSPLGSLISGVFMNEIEQTLLVLQARSFIGIDMLLMC